MIARRPLAPVVVPWDCDVEVPLGIRTVARKLGARAAWLRHGRIVVVLSDGREVWLNERGEQTGVAPGGRPVAIWDDVPWPMASVSERTRAA